MPTDNAYGFGRYAVWTDTNGQDDLEWQNAYDTGYGKGVYVEWSKHPGSWGERYNIHVYDIFGNFKCATSFVLKENMSNVQ